MSNKNLLSNKKPRGYWTQDKVFAEGKKYPNRRSWQLAQSRSYNIAWTNGWLDQIIGREIVHGTWTKEAVLANGVLYPTKTAWRNSKDGSAYVIAKRNGWISELKHFERELSFGERTIYKWLLSRDIEHECEKTFQNLRDKYPLRFDFWVPSKKLLIEYQGRQHELGWGGVSTDASEIKKRDAIKSSYAEKNGMYLLLIDSQLEDEINSMLESHIGKLQSRDLAKKEINQIKNLGGWSKEKAIQDAKKYKTRNEWDLASYGYSYARKNGFLDEACAHMVRVHGWTSSRKKIWTKEAVVLDAKNHITPGAWKNANPSAYAISLKNGWHQEATLHMKSRLKK